MLSSPHISQIHFAHCSACIRREIDKFHEKTIPKFFKMEKKKKNLIGAFYQTVGAQKE